MSARGAILVLPRNQSHQGRDLGLSPLDKGAASFCLDGNDAVGFGIRPKDAPLIKSLIAEARIPHEIRTQ